MRFGCVIVVCLLLLGCATDPLAQFEAGTPTLSEGQVARLQRGAKTPEQLGIRVVQDGLVGVNLIQGTEPVTAPLVRVDSDQPQLPGGRYRVPVILGEVNGHRNVRLMLDSGSNRLLLGYSLAQAVNVPILSGLKPVKAMGIGGAVDNYIGVVPSLRIGELQLEKMIAMISPDAQALSFTRRFWGKSQVMIFGIAALRQMAYVSIDNLNGTVTLSPNAPYAPDRTRALVAAVQLRWKDELPMVELMIDNRAVPCILDTGGDYGMLIPRSLAGPLGYWKPGQERLSASRGVGGASLTTQYNVRAVKLANATFEQVPARTDLSGPEPAGGYPLMGNIVLRRHKVTFDFRNGVLWLER